MNEIRKIDRSQSRRNKSKRIYLLFENDDGDGVGDGNDSLAYTANCISIISSPFLTG